MGRRSITSNGKTDEMPVLALGGNGRVAHLLRAAWAFTGEDRVIWQSRNEQDGMVCFDPIQQPDHFAGHLPKNGILFALAGVTPASGGDLGDNSSLARAAIIAAKHAKARHVFFVSTAAVYGTAVDGLCNEDDTLRPTSAYGIAKRDMEQAVGANEIAATILRIGNVLGGDQLIGRVGHGADIRLEQFADGSHPMRSYIGPITLARVLSRLCDLALSDHPLPEVLNVATPHPVSMADLLRANGNTWENVPASTGAIRSVQLEVARLCSLFEFAPDASDPATMIAELNAIKGITG